jgi:hypothetical protein
MARRSSAATGLVRLLASHLVTLFAEECVRQACRLVLFLIERDSASRNNLAVERKRLGGDGSSWDFIPGAPFLVEESLR